MRPREKITIRPGWAKIFLLGFFLLFLPEILPAEEGSGLYIDENLQMGLGDQFFKEGDYYRAITEYKRFLFFFPQSPRAEEALWKVAQSYFSGRKWDEAISACENLLKIIPASSLRSEVLLLTGRAFAEKKEYSQARIILEKAREGSPGTPVEDDAQLQIALTYVKEEKWAEAAQEFRKIDKNSKLYPKGEFFAQGLDRIQEVPQKSPGMAGVLAAVLPGAGHLYCERYRDATLAFLLNGAFIWGIVESFEHNNYVVGGILTFFELGWYSGNIYSAVSSAHKYNKKRKDEYLNYLEKGSDLSVGISFQGKTPILSFRYDF